MIPINRIPFYIHDFLNAVPIIYPILEQKVFTSLELCLAKPARIADIASSGERFSGVIPSAAAMKRNDFAIINSFCIASKGAVKTVCFYSQKALGEVSSILLDDRSRTSHLMLRLIFALKGMKLPEFKTGEINIKAIKNGDFDGILIIGDDNILYEKELSSFIKYDLGELWFSLTGKQFVHAVTVTNSPSEEGDIIREALRDCLKYSFSHCDEMIEYASIRYGMEKTFCKEYLTKTIRYDFDKESQEGLKAFYQFSQEYAALSLK